MFLFVMNCHVSFQGAMPSSLICGGKRVILSFKQCKCFTQLAVCCPSKSPSCFWLRESLHWRMTFWKQTLLLKWSLYHTFIQMWQTVKKLLRVMSKMHILLLELLPSLVLSCMFSVGFTLAASSGTTFQTQKGKTQLHLHRISSCTNLLKAICFLFHFFCVFLSLFVSVWEWTSSALELCSQ